MDLALKSALGLLNLAMVMYLAIFLPSGSIYYPEAWSYLAIFFAAVIGISLYIFRNDKALLQSRLKGGATAEKRSLQKLVQAVASLGFVGLYIIAAFDHRFHWSHVPQWVVIAPDLVLLFTMLLFFIVFKKNSYLSAVIEVQEGQKILMTGPTALYGTQCILRHYCFLVFRPWVSPPIRLYLHCHWCLWSLYSVASMKKSFWRMSCPHIMTIAVEWGGGWSL